MASKERRCSILKLICTGRLVKVALSARPGINELCVLVYDTLLFSPMVSDVIDWDFSASTTFLFFENLKILSHPRSVSSKLPGPQEKSIRLLRWKPQGDQPFEDLERISMCNAM